MRGDYERVMFEEMLAPLRLPPVQGPLTEFEALRRSFWRAHGRRVMMQYSKPGFWGRLR